MATGTADEGTPKKKGWFPDSLVLIFSLIIVAQILSYVIPSGTFERAPAPFDSHREMVLPGSFTAAPDAPALEPWHFLSAIPRGLESAQEIIFLVFLVGGVIALLRASGAIDAILFRAVRTFSSSPGILIGGTLLLFGLGAFTIGMGEEYMPLIPILVTMCLAMKLDSIVAMGILWASYGVGWATAGTNPFGVLIAQDIAGLPPTSGLGFRIVIFLLCLLVAFQHIYAYAKKIAENPSKSLVAHVDYSEGFSIPEDVSFTWQRKLILGVFTAGIVFFVYGAQNWGWYILELITIFLAIGVLTAVIARMDPNDAAKTFIAGAAEMTAAALLIGFARTIEVVLTDGMIIDTIINAIASMLDGTGPDVSALGMLLVQTITNFFIPSGSGQAFVTMPIMSPLADLTGVSQQTAVLAYQFGDGFTNMVVPTSALVVGTLALGKIPYVQWVKFVTPLLIKLFALAAAILVFTVHFGEYIGFAN
ncbi:YfcC family protein [Kordiimonas aestuarii]|uniref:YfcC family protein n=1 Tax=Kordiimonas aestuarii TaxID=1005925 RepID=UPI0021CF45DB|nr:TIGR00366 family protein [Kordiimonas aestuarii]